MFEGNNHFFIRVLRNVVLYFGCNISYVLVTSYWGMAVSRNRTWCEYLGTDFVSFFKSSGGFSKYSYSPSFPTLVDLNCSSSVVNWTFGAL